MRREIRSFEDAEFRIQPDSRMIEGYALKFNKESRDLGGFKEVILPEAMDGIIERSDIFALYNHIPDKVLARSTNGQGTLSLSVDNIGLKYRFYAPNTAIGDEVLDAIKRGDLRNSSFAFNIAKGGEKKETRNGERYRIITRFDKLYDVSPVYTPAYQDTTVALRSLGIDTYDNNESNEITFKIDGDKLVSMLNRKKQEVDMTEDRKVEIIINEIKEESTEQPNPTELVDDIENTPVENPVESIVEDVIDTESPVEDMPMEPIEEVTSSDESIDVLVDGKTYSIPKNVLEPYLTDENRARKLEIYFENIQRSIDELKK